MSELKLLTDQAIGDRGSDGQDGLDFDTYAGVLGDAGEGCSRHETNLSA